MSSESLASVPNPQPAEESLDQVLAHFEPFNTLPADELAGLVSFLVERDYRLGQTLLEAHVLPTSVFCLLQG